MLRVSLPRRSGILARRGLALNVSCERGCRVLVTATLSPRSPRRPVALVAAIRPLPATLTGHVRLRVGSAALHRLRRTLGRHLALRELTIEIRLDEELRLLASAARRRGRGRCRRWRGCCRGW